MKKIYLVMNASTNKWLLLTDETIKEEHKEFVDHTITEETAIGYFLTWFEFETTKAIIDLMVSKD